MSVIYALQSIMSEIRLTWFYTSIYISLHVYNMSQTCILLKQAHTCMLRAGGMHVVRTRKLRACIMHVACEHEFQTAVTCMLHAQDFAEGGD